MIKKAVEKGLTQKNCYLGIKPLVVNFMEKHSHQLSMQKYIQIRTFDYTHLGFQFSDFQLKSFVDPKPVEL